MFFWFSSFDLLNRWDSRLNKKEEGEGKLSSACLVQGRISYLVDKDIEVQCARAKTEEVK